MIKKRDCELHCPNGHIYRYSDKFLAFYTWDKAFARIRRYERIQDGDSETTQLAEWKELSFIARHLGNRDKKEIAEYQAFVNGKPELATA